MPGMSLGIGLWLGAPGGITAPAAPANTVAPAITGILTDGQVLTSSNGSWSGYPAPTFAYQWKRGAGNIGTNSATYTLVTADVAQNITCTVTATNASGNASQASNTVVPAAALAISGTPATTGTVGSAYSFTPSASGGHTTYVFSVANKPSWASFSTSTGALTGTPTGAETDASINITVTDSDGLTASLGAWTITVTSGLAAYTGAVSTRTAIPNAITAAATKCMARTRHIARDNITSLQVIYGAWWINVGATPETATGADLTIKVAVEYPSGTNLGYVQWSASSTGTITAGTTKVSDAFAATIPTGAAFFLRTYVTKTTAGIPYTTPNTGGMFDAGNGEVFEASTTAADVTSGTGTWTPPSGGSTLTNIWPLAVVATTTQPSFLLLGDSRFAGTQDTVSAGGDVGEAARAVGPSYAYINLGVPNDTVSTWTKNRQLRIALAQYTSHILSDLGVNDIRGGSGLGLTAAVTDAHERNLWDVFYGAKPVVHFTSAPQTTSSDAWATTGANQTVDTNAAALTTHNTYILTTPSPLAASVDVAGAVVAPATSGQKWNAPGYTADGVHETPTAYALAAAVPNAATLAALTAPASCWTPFALFPINLAGLYGFWLDQSVTTSSVAGLSNGNSASPWLSRNSGAQFSQATAGKKPTLDTASINGLDSYRFTTASSQEMQGSSSILKVLNGQNGALFAAVVKINTQAANGWILDVRGGSGSGRVSVGVTSALKLNSLTRRLDADTGDQTAGATTLVSGTSYLITGYFDPTTNSKILWLNGTQEISTVLSQTSGSFSATDSTSVNIGSQNGSIYWNGNMGEVILLPGQYTTGDRQKLEGYLAHKWGVTLPGGHPYFSAAP